jgi:hypothetical protein
MSRYNRLVVRRILTLVLAATALSGCAVLPPVLSGVSSAITIGEWLRARARAGLPPQEHPVGNPSAGADDPAANSSSAKDPYQAALEHAYRQGVRDAIRQLTEGLGRDPRWTWVVPIVQEVWIPPQVVNGVFIPGHREWVMIRPGQWQAEFGLPLGSPPTLQPAGGLPSPPPPASTNRAR